MEKRYTLGAENGSVLHTMHFKISLKTKTMLLALDSWEMGLVILLPGDRLKDYFLQVQLICYWCQEIVDFHLKEK